MSGLATRATMQRVCVSVVLAQAVCLSVLVAADRAVQVYGAVPALPEVATQWGELRIGTVQLSGLSTEQDTLLATIPGTLRAILRPDPLRDAHGNSRPGTWSGQYQVAQLVTDQRQNNGTIRTEQVLDLTTLGGPLPRLTINGRHLGDLYWYQGASVAIVDLIDGVRFSSVTDASAFRLAHVERVGLPGPRLRVAMGLGHIDVHTGVRMPAGNPIRTVALSSLTGAWLVVPELGTNERRYFRERDLAFANPADQDLYLMNGGFISAVPAVNNNGQFNIVFRRLPYGDEVQATGHLTQSRAVTALPEPYRTQEINYQDDGTPTFPVDRSHQRGDMDGQDMNALARAVTAAPHDQTGAADIEQAIAAARYFAPDGTLDRANPQRPPGDPQLDPVQSIMDPDRLANRQQAELHGLTQLAPQVNDPAHNGGNGVPDEWMRATLVTEAKMARHMEGSQPLRGLPSVRHAMMHPADLRLPDIGGQLSPDKSGPAEPPDGDNPTPARPRGLTPQGSPFYDFDGDGDLDRWFTTDPWENEYEWLRIRWVFDNDYRAHRSWADDAPWAAYVINRKGVERLLFCAEDHVRNRVDKRRRGTKLGVTYYGPALMSFLEPVPGVPQTYHLSLRFIGSVIDPPPGQPYPPQPEVRTDTRTEYRTVTLLDGTEVQIPTKNITESAELYRGVMEAGEIAGGVWSEVGYRPFVVPAAPDAPVRLVRTEVQLETNPPQTTVRTLWYPDWFRPENIEPEQQGPPEIRSDRWMFDFAGFDATRPPSPANAPWNYKRMAEFGRHSAFGFELNPPHTLATFAGGAAPIITTDGVVSSGVQTIHFEVEETGPTFADPVTQAQWVERRSMQHSRGWGSHDPRTDMNPGRHFVHQSGDRRYRITQGVGFYIFKGARRDYRSLAEQTALIRDMWTWYFRVPRTIFHEQRINPADSTSPLLNTAQPKMLGQQGVTSLIENSDAALVQEAATTAGSVEAAVRRRNRLMKEQVYFFSAGRGREWEVAYAKEMPKTTRLVCCEYDDAAAVSEAFAETGHVLEFLDSDAGEDAKKGEIITHYFGKAPAVAVRTTDGVIGAAVHTAEDVTAGATQDPGRYIFTRSDQLYGLPALRLGTVALLDDNQYGTPRSDQWHTSHMMEFRHPMLIYYDDRWSSIVVAYGHQTDPRVVFGRWDQHGPPQHGTPQDACRTAFEAWVQDDTNRLNHIYNELNQTAYNRARMGQALLPAEPPRPGAEPQQPVAPVMQAVPPTAPAVVAHPGPAPQPPQPPQAPWSLHTGYDGLTIDQAAPRWLAEPQRLDGSKRGQLVRFAGWARRDYASEIPSVVAGLEWIERWRRRTNIADRDEDDEYRWSVPTQFGFDWVQATHASFGHNVGLNGSAHDYFGSAVTGVIINRGGTIPVHMTARGDNTYGVFREGVRVHARGQPWWSANIESGAFWTDIPGGHSRWVFTHTELSQVAGYDFAMNNLDVVAMVASNGLLDVYPIYPPHPVGNQAAEASLAAYRQAEAQWAQVNQDYVLALAAWQEDQQEYDQYLLAVSLYQQQLTAYANAASTYATAQAQYQSDLASFPHRHAAWAAASAAWNAWDALRQQHADAVGLWATYEAAREAWRLLVQADISLPGVQWSSPTAPVFSAFHFWGSHIDTSGSCGGGA